MTKKKSEMLTDEQKKQVSDFAEKFPVELEVTVMIEGVGRVVAYVAGPAKLVDGELRAYIKYSDGKAVEMSLDRIRHRRTETKATRNDLRVKLTDSEKLEAGRLLGEANIQAGKLETDKKACAKDFDLRIGKVESEAAVLVNKVTTGHETRPVDCDMVFDYDLGTATETRKDTGEVISKRELTQSERIVELPLKVEPIKLAETPVEVTGQTQEPAMPPAALVAITPEEIEEAKAVLRETRRASVSSLQRRMKVNYAKASRIMDELEEKGIVGPPNGEEPREILMSLNPDAE